MPASTKPFVLFLNHRSVCATCFTHTLLDRKAPLCEEGKALQKEFLPLWDAENPATRSRKS